MIKLEDINFDLIDDKQFESLCFELLLRLGYQDLKWRGGTNDQGRDIEGKIRINYPLLGNISEECHFECKKYHQSVPKKVFLDKIAWADANKPDRLIFLISSQITNQTKHWVQEISRNKSYHLHFIEGKILK